MKSKLFCFAVLLCLFQLNSVVAQTTDYQAIADKIVNQVLEIQPGEVVSIAATPAELDMLTDFIVAVSKAGGKPFVNLNIPEANKKSLLETPIIIF